MSTQPPAVSVVIVSYETRELTLASVASVLADRGSDLYEITVIDNASRDGTVEALRRNFPSVNVIANERNRGFGAAANQGMTASAGRHILLMNPDAEVRDHAIAETLAYAEAHPEAGVVGCRVVLPDGSRQSSIYRVVNLREVLINSVVPNSMMRRNSFLGRSRYVGTELGDVRDVEVIAGCFMFVRREVIEQVGLFDEAFFMYGEDEEWCHRIRAGGWSLHYFPGASVLHHGGASARQFPSRMARAMARSRLLVLQKTRGDVVAYVANLLMLMRDLPRVVVWGALSPIPSFRGSPLEIRLRTAVSRISVHARGVLCLDWRSDDGEP